MKIISPWGDSPALRFALKELEGMGYTVAEPGEDTQVLLLPVPSGISGETLPGVPLIIGGGMGDGDLFREPDFAAENAAITAHCALQTAMVHMDITFDGARVLVLGWGRIGKKLAQLLKALGAEVTVYARKASDRAMLKALGYSPAEQPKAEAEVVFNTIPQDIGADAGNSLGIELASGKFLGGSRVISARGLPGKLAPKSAGRLIARTAHTIIIRKEQEK